MKDRVVVQYDKRDVETLKLIKLDLLGLGMLAAIDETLQRIERDCATCVDLDRLPEEIPEVFAMLQAADTVGVFQVESRAQMQTLPKSRPASLDDLVVEVAIIRPGPIQGNAVHPYLRRKQGLEPVTYLHPSLEPVLRDSLGVILYQEQVMRVAIEVAGFTPGRVGRVPSGDGDVALDPRDGEAPSPVRRRLPPPAGMDEATAEELFRQVAAFASFGFAKSHAAAFARTAYESSFLKLFYPAQFLVGLINAQPMGFYPVEVLVNDAKRHGVAVLPVDVNASAYLTTTEWVGLDPEPLPPDAGIDRRPTPVRSPACVIPSDGRPWSLGGRERHRLGRPARARPGQGDRRGARRAARRGARRRPVSEPGRRRRADRRCRRRSSSGSSGPAGSTRSDARGASSCGSSARSWAPAAGGSTDGRPGPPRGPRSAPPAGRSTSACRRPRPPSCRRSARSSGSATPTRSSRSTPGARSSACSGRRSSGSGRSPNSALNEHRPGPVRIGGLVVTRQHPMTAQGDGLPGPRGRDRDGQRHPLAGRLGAAARGGPAACAAARRRDPPARGRGGQRDRPGGPAAARGHGRGRRARPGPRASASSASPGCAGWASGERRDRQRRAGALAACPAAAGVPRRSGSPGAGTAGRTRRTPPIARPASGEITDPIQHVSLRAGRPDSAVPGIGPTSMYSAEHDPRRRARRARPPGSSSGRSGRRPGTRAASGGGKTNRLKAMLGMPASAPAARARTRRRRPRRARSAARPRASW